MARVQIKRIMMRREIGWSESTRGPSLATRHSASLDLWMKELAPSTVLRKWFNHDPDRWTGFRQRYRRELGKHGKELAALKAQAAKRRVTLLFGARDTLHNEAVVLRDTLQPK
jgi:uncharacterized protein YeaO (DUF488 family)